ncbi:Integral membrane protein DGCR2/IDD [Orchesella cincta]|uniref:Integral membrane protein DGCR2/IDD n=1 Tax=Orchesella cincta TaxID=48709 RepID=A0A1D2NG77_ORCCI|nr:Integral membrane protein DGCR2/IDD [Orchesella cincta]
MMLKIIMTLHLGVLATPLLAENATHQIFHGFGAVNGGVTGQASGGQTGGGLRPSLGKHCIDLHQRLIPHGVHFVPGPDECTLCACDDGEPKWCKAVLCSPPQDCKSFRVGNSCCDFICLDDSLNNNGPNTGGPYLSRPVEIANFVPKVVIAAVTAMLSLSLLFFLIHRLRQRHIQGRLNSARARRSTQMCDECDDTRSLDFSNDFFEHRMNSPHLYPPQYLAWWKPPSSYFPPRGEAPPPYEEAMMATTSIGGGAISNLTVAVPLPSYNNNNLQNNNNTQSSGGLLSDIPIIVPPPGPVQAHNRSPAIQRLASAIANTSASSSSKPACTTTVITSASAKNAKESQNQAGGGLENGADAAEGAASSSSSSPKTKSDSSKQKQKSSKSHHNHNSTNHHEPRAGTSRGEVTDSSSSRQFRIKPPQHGPAPPTYEDAIYSLHPAPPPAPQPVTGRDHYRHSLTLPPRRYLENPTQTHQHLVVAAGYPSVVIRGGGCNNGSSQGHLSLFPEHNSSSGGNCHNHNQRYSLQFPVGCDLGRRAEDSGDWSSSSSTLSLSTTPNSPVGRPPSSSSSESSVSESHSHPPPPPPAPSSTSNNSSRA